MDSKKLAEFLKEWWGTLLLLPFVLMSVHQIWQAFTTHILMLVYYDYVFPYNIVYFLIFHFDLIVHEAGTRFSPFSATGLSTSLADPSTSCCCRLS